VTDDFREAFEKDDPRPQSYRFPQPVDQKIFLVDIAQKEAKRRNLRNFAGRIVGSWEVRQESAAFVLVWVDPR
jgi:hypothetical protein